MAESSEGQQELKVGEDVVAVEKPTELKEFEKLDSLLSLIPRRAQHGILKSCDLILTCLDATSTYIALGSNIGLTFLYSRKDQSVQRIKLMSSNDVITSVRLHEGIDHLLAVGTASGEVTVFCIPGIVSVHKKQLQKFDVKDIHKHYISCLEWSTNGMKLYSADKKGQVVVTEVDFYLGQSASSLLLVEQDTEIIQLDYNHKVLLVSTRQRSFIVRLDQKCLIVDVGTQDRKMPGPFGACFIPGLCKTDDARLYAARPGCRLWLSDIHGVVRNTYIFSHPLSSGVPEIPLLSSGKLPMNVPDFQLGNLKCFRDKEVVSWSSSALVVLDPESNQVLARQSRLSGIIDVAVVNSGEIFVLRRHAESRLIRISDKPETKTITAEILTASKPIVLQDPGSMKADEKTQEKENPAKSFFMKTLSKPLKKLDNLIHDNKQSTATQSDETADLPPVVRLASPELDGVRVFTSSSKESPIRTGPESSTATSSAVTNASTNPTASKFSESEVLAQENDLNVGAPPLAPFEHISNTAASQHGQDTGQDDIVFSHRMKKHKKKHKKVPLLNMEEKKEDTINQLSASHLPSTDAVSGEKSYNPELKPDSSLEAIQRADDVLEMVDRILKKDSASTNVNKDVVAEASAGVEDISGQNVYRDEAPTNTDAGIMAGGVTNDGIEQEEGASNADTCDVLSEDGKTLEEAVCLPNLDKCTGKDVLSFQENGGSRIESVTGTYLSEINSFSESDQHIKSIPYEPAFAPVARVEQRQMVRDNSQDIVNIALANLDACKSRLAEQEGAPLDQKAVSYNFQISDQSDQDIYSEVSAIESTNPFKKGTKREPSVDDFYSMFLDTSPESPEYLPPEPAQPAQLESLKPTDPIESKLTDRTMNVSQHRLANSWSEFTTPANIYSMALTQTHVWFTDKNENIYYSSIGNPKGIVWRKASGQANQISVSPSGHIVWRLHKGVVFAGTKINSRHPEGLKWVEAVRDVEYIAVDDNCAWYIKRNGEVMMQRGLYQERPCYKSYKIECPHTLKMIHCRQGIVWAITEGLRLLVRTGVNNDVPEGTGWELDARDTAPYLFSSIVINNENIGWAIDVLGQIWFCDGVTQEQPFGSSMWWQIPMSEYILYDVSMMDMVRTVAKKFDPKKLSYIMSTNRGGIITAGVQGVWLALDFRNVIQVCHESLQGYHWLQAHPAQMSHSSAWKILSAGAAHHDWGLVWAQLTNGDIYVFAKARSEASLIAECYDFCCLSVVPTAVWALTMDGCIKIRSGMSPESPKGNGWVDLDLSQLDGYRIVHLSCNSHYVWAVGSEGDVFHRIGIKSPSETNLSPVWLPIDTFADIVFSHIHTGPLDWMVWAVDNRRLIYMRVGITEEMPLGQEWVHVPGIQSIDLALTQSGVWALTPNGEIFFRYGITQKRPAGNYWKKIPGTFLKISASAMDDLWGINTENELMHCNVRYLLRHQESNNPHLQRAVSTGSAVSDDLEWEIV